MENRVNVNQKILGVGDRIRDNCRMVVNDKINFGGVMVNKINPILLINSFWGENEK